MSYSSKGRRYNPIYRITHPYSYLYFLSNQQKWLLFCFIWALAEYLLPFYHYFNYFLFIDNAFENFSAGLGAKMIFDLPTQNWEAHWVLTEKSYSFEFGWKWIVHLNFKLNIEYTTFEKKTNLQNCIEQPSQRDTAG